MSNRVFDESAKQRIVALVKGALAIVTYDKQITIKFERVGAGTFDNQIIGAVCRNSHTIVVNVDWYKNTSDDDIKFLLRHEARHMYQMSQIEKYQTGEKTQEKLETIRQWAYEFTHYIPNTPGTEVQHFQQACELDAYVFATFIANVENMGSEGVNLSWTDYPGIGDQIRDSVMYLFQSTPQENLMQYRDFYKSQKV